MNESTVIALGFFDGVHIGHGELLKMAVRRAQERGCRSAAFTFDRSPREFVTGKPVPLLTTPSERANIIRTQYGVQEVFVEPFDRNMMTMPWEDFISELLVRKYHAVHLVAGHDFRFGHKNEGDVEKLRSYCAAHGLGCDIIPRVEKDGVTVSSTYIRSLLEAGEVRRAAEFLGHYFSVEGTVRHGEGIGKKALFPTANLIPEEHIIALKRGVYATRAHLPNGETCVGVTNVGVRPTVSDKNTVTIETYLVGFDGDLYGQKLQLDFFDYLREEKKFSSTQELHDMIAQNAREAERTFPSPVTQPTRHVSSTSLQALTRNGLTKTALNTSRLLRAAAQAVLFIRITLRQVPLHTVLPTLWAECTATLSSQVLPPFRLTLK